MKIYGQESTIEEHPNQRDLGDQSRKSSTGNLPEKCGCFKPNLRSSSQRRKLRKVLKSPQRRKNKDIDKHLDD